MIGVNVITMIIIISIFPHFLLFFFFSLSFLKFFNLKRLGQLVDLWRYINIIIIIVMIIIIFSTTVIIAIHITMNAFFMASAKYR